MVRGRQPASEAIICWSANFDKAGSAQAFLSENADFRRRFILLLLRRGAIMMR
jgi:hypothetical protein